jgi:hypothetical protein
LIITRFQHSGLGAREFCRNEGLDSRSLLRWQERLARQATPAARDPGPAFVELGSMAHGATARSRLDLRLDLGEGWVLHLVRS